MQNHIVPAQKQFGFMRKVPLWNCGSRTPSSSAEQLASDMIVHVTTILMESTNLETVKTHHNDRRRRGAHKAAREVLDEYANGSEQVSVDMSDMSWWEEYVASQAVATEMAAVGITGFSIQSILGIKDPNRGGRDRVDFIVFLADGTHWRLHPGSKQKSDAQPVHIQTLTQKKCNAAKPA